MKTLKPNRLSKAGSPYLRQHANNPVDWYEWGEEALTTAMRENKPLIISIGYAACHWCHVMAKESFMDDAIAELMNRNFVCIKVDREERPDIDQIYMEAAQLISGRGGWPLNAFALPDGRPFYAATYFPPQQWTDVLQQLSSLFATEFQRIENAAISLTQGLQTNPFSIISKDEKELFDSSDYDTVFENLLAQVDFSLGGFNGAPKFMMPIGWEFLLQYYHFTNHPKALQAVTSTLDAMVKGGIYDQIGGGFARYATDAIWKVPHFEKMLYDNAQLVTLYAHAFQITKNQEYSRIIEETLAFAERELMSPEGGFYASIDADSEHEEGKFYVWTKSEFEATLDPAIAALLTDFYHISASGNWENGKNILYYSLSKAEFAAQHNLLPTAFEELLQQANQRLLQYRNNRIRPATDDKILTAWNALMLSGYVAAYKALSNPDYLSTALRLASLLEEKLLCNGILYRNYKEGKTSVEGFLEDYALLAEAWMQLYEITFDMHWLQLSKQLTDYALLHFASSENALCFFTSNLSEKLISRKYDYTDNVIPSSNSVFANVLHKLGILFDDANYTTKAAKMLQLIHSQLMQGGVYFAHWSILAGRQIHPSLEIAIVGDDALQLTPDLQKEYLPNAVFAGGNEENLPLLSNRLMQGQTIIYVCQDKMCHLPVHSTEEALTLIQHLKIR